LKVLVTGANGFLGRHVVQSLLDAGMTVRALVRPASRIDRLGWNDAERVEIFRADLRAATNLEAAFEGIDALIHLAAQVAGSDEARFVGTVVATERLLDAMARSQTRRLIHISSYSVYDWRATRGALTEQTPLEGADVYDRDGYAVAKLWQERVVRRAAEAHGWDFTVIRPGFVWGRDQAEVAGMGQRVGPFFFVVAPTARLPLTHVENAAHAIVTATADPRAIGRTFNLVDGPGIRAWTLAGAYRKGTGQRFWRVPVPYAPARLAVGGIQAISRWIFRGKGKLPSLLVPRRFEARFRPLRHDGQALRETLGWRPPLDTDACLKRTFGPSSEPSEAAPSPSGPIQSLMTSGQDKP